jgi:ATP-dependent Lon protease
MASLERNSPEFNVTRSYLDWLTQMPWGKKTVDELDLHKASEVLNVDHYGLGESFPLPPFPFLLRPRSLV